MVCVRGERGVGVWLVEEVGEGWMYGEWESWKRGWGMVGGRGERGMEAWWI